MICAKTKLKKIPQSCNKCSFSKFEGSFVASYRVCTLTGSVCRKENLRGTAWKYTRNSDCPLFEVDK